MLVSQREKKKGGTICTRDNVIGQRGGGPKRYRRFRRKGKKKRGGK